MFGIGTGELLVILVIAMLAIGPERMVEFAGQLGRFIAKFRAETDTITKEFREAFTLEIEGTADDSRPTPPRISTQHAVSAPKEAAPAVTEAPVAESALKERTAVETTARVEESVEEPSIPLILSFVDSELDLAPVIEDDDDSYSDEEAEEGAELDETIVEASAADGGAHPQNGDGEDDDEPIVISVGELVREKPEEAEPTAIDAPVLIVDDEESSPNQGEEADRHAADEG